MAVTSTVKLDRRKIRLLDKAAIKALEKTAEALHTEVVQAQVVPRDTGVLQGEKMFVDTSESSIGHVDIIHEGPYARRLYYHPEYNFQKTENTNAKGKWFDDWLPGGGYEDFAQETFNKLYKREAGI